MCDLVRRSAACDLGFSSLRCHLHSYPHKSNTIFCKFVFLLYTLHACFKLESTLGNYVEVTLHFSWMVEINLHIIAQGLLFQLWMVDINLHIISQGLLFQLWMVDINLHIITRSLLFQLKVGEDLLTFFICLIEGLD